MLNDANASEFKKVYLATGFTDLRRGIDGLANIIRFHYGRPISYADAGVRNRRKESYF